MDLKIKTYLYAADKQFLRDSRNAKVKPLYDPLNEKLKMFGVNHNDVSIDEFLVLLFGRQLYKHFIRAKQIRFGYKISVLAVSIVMPYQKDFYEGKTAATINEPLETRFVKKALQVCIQPK